MQPSSDIRRLIEIMAALRTPKTGCPWDLEQTHQSLTPYALEEAYEVVDAIERGDMEGLRDELGDLLLQVVFHAQLAQETGHFAFGDVVEAVTGKLVRRHPHVFSDAAKPKPAKSGVDKIWEAMRARRAMLDGGIELEDEGPDHGLVAAMRSAEDKVAFSNETWESIKAAERKAKAGAAPGTVLSGVPHALPGLSRAVKLQRKASTVGFDWSDARLVLAKIREEIDEIEEAFADGGAERVGDEIGDLVFAVANLARHAEVDPEAAVRATNRKFERRFAFIEAKLAERSSSPKDASLDEMEALWQEAKRSEIKPSEAKPSEVKASAEA